MNEAEQDPEVWTVSAWRNCGFSQDDVRKTCDDKGCREGDDGDVPGGGVHVTLHISAG